MVFNKFKKQNFNTNNNNKKNIKYITFSLFTFTIFDKEVWAKTMIGVYYRKFFGTAEGRIILQEYENIRSNFHEGAYDICHGEGEQLLKCQQYTNDLLHAIQSFTPQIDRMNFFRKLMGCDLYDANWPKPIILENHEPTIKPWDYEKYSSYLTDMLYTSEGQRKIICSGTVDECLYCEYIQTYFQNVLTEMVKFNDTTIFGETFFLLWLSLVTATLLD